MQLYIIYIKYVYERLFTGLNGGAEVQSGAAAGGGRRAGVGRQRQRAGVADVGRDARARG